MQSMLEELQLTGIPGIGTGGKVESWVNIKIDKDLPIRVSRYATALDEYIGKSTELDLHTKLEYLSNPIRKGRGKGAQAKLAIMILLQYLKEIRNNFDSSSAGFLFEDYIAGLLHSKKEGGKESADYIGEDGTTYQIKFYREDAGKIEINMKECDSYIIGVKYYNSVRIWIIEHKSDKSKYLGIAKRYKRAKKVNGVKIEGEYVKDYRFIDVKSIKEDLEPFEIRFDNIDNLIKEAGKQLKDIVSELYKSISDLNYNIETIITGVDSKEKFVGSDIDSYYTGAVNNISNIGTSIEAMKKDLKRRKYPL